MKDWGRAGAYVALFSEIAAILLSTTLAGLFIGWWVDRQLATLPIFLATNVVAELFTDDRGPARFARRLALRVSDRLPFFKQQVAARLLAR